MPIYVVTGPDGKKYKVNAPEGATEQQAIAYIADTHYVGDQSKTVFEDYAEEVPLLGDLAIGAADIGLGAVQGLFGVAGAAADTFGANNVVSRFSKDVAQGARGWMSAQERGDLAEGERIMREAEGKGILAEVGAAIEAFSKSPLTMTAQGIGSAAPFIAAGVLSGGSAAPVALGALTGTGTVKGSVYDSVEQAAIEKGVDPKIAKAMAAEAQGYLGDNVDQIALGTVLGGIAGRFGLEGAAAKLFGKELAESAVKRSVIGGAARGAIAEGGTEAMQAGQERFAGNLGADRAGFDTPLTEGVFGQATLEALMGAGPGAVFGGKATSAENARATAEQYEEKVNALPDTPTQEDVDGVAEWAMRRGFSEEEARVIGRNAAEQKQRAAQAKAEAEAALQARRDEMLAGVEPSAEPDISAPPSVDPEEEAARIRAYEAEAGGQTIIPPIEEVSPQAQVAEQLTQVGVRPNIPQPTAMSPEQAGIILNDPVALSDYEAAGGDIQTLYDIADGVTPDRGPRAFPQRGRRPRDTQTEDMFGSLPLQEAPGIEAKREELAAQRFASEEERTALQEQAASEMEAGQERAAQLRQRDEENREETLGDIEYALRAQAPENAVYKVIYDPEDASPYKLVAETQLGKKPEEVLRAETLQDFSDQVYGRMMELTPYIPPAPAAIQEIEERESGELESPTVATRMVQEFTAEVDAAHQAGLIDNLQRSELLRRLERPDAYRTLPNGRQVPSDAIARLEKAAQEAASAANNASAEEQEAAATAAKEANDRLAAAVKNSLLNPARAALKTMVETRKDEKLGARIRQKEAEATGDTREARDAKIDREQLKVTKRQQGKIAQNDPRTPEQVEAEVGGMSANEVMDWLVDTAPNQAFATIARGVRNAVRRLQKFGLGFNFQIVKDPAQLPQAVQELYDDSAAIAHIEGRDTTVYVNPTAAGDMTGMSYETILHEFVHAATIPYLEMGSLTELVGGTRTARLVIDLEDVLRAIRQHMRDPDNVSSLPPLVRDALGGFANVFDNEHELLAWTLSNPDVMEYLDTVPYLGNKSKQSIFRRFIEVVRNILGLSAKSDSALAEVLRIGNQLLYTGDIEAARILTGNPSFKLTYTAAQKKLKEGQKRLSDGARKVEKTTSTQAMAEGLGEMTEGHKFKDWAKELWDNWGRFSPAKQATILKAMPTSGILGWVKPQNKALYNAMAEIDERVQKMQALKMRIINASEDLARDIQDFADAHGTDTLARLQAMARINEVAPDEFGSLAEALKKNAVIQEIEKKLLRNSNNKAETQKLIDEIKDVVVRGKDSVQTKGDKFTMGRELLGPLAKLQRIAKDANAVKDRVEQLAEMTRRIRDVKELWEELGKQKNGHKIYKEMRSFYKDMFEAELALLDERINLIADKEEATRIKDMRAKLMREVIEPDERKKQGDLFYDIDAELFQKDYVPFMRQGQYWLRVTGAKDGSREREFYTFNTERELRAAQKAVAKRLGIDPESNSGILSIGLDVAELQDHLKTEDALMQRVFQIVSDAKNNFSRSNEVNLKEIADSIYQTWLMTTPERSVRRRLMHAEEVVGFSTDTFLNFRTQATTYANQLSKLAYAGQIRLAVDEARDIINDPERGVTEKARYNAFVSEIESRANQELNPSPQSDFFNFVNRTSYFYYLTSAKTALLQLTSIPIRVVPRLWRDYGYAKGTAMWLKYMKLWNSLGRVKVERENTRFGDRIDAIMPNVNGSEFVRSSADLRWAKRMGMERGILETLHDTLVQNERATPGRTTTGVRRMAGDTVANTGKVMSFLFNGMENISRQAAYYMTFELAVEKYRKENPKATDEAARNYAFKQAIGMVRGTLSDYTSWERPNIIKGNLGRSLFLFKMHPITQTRFLVGAMRDIITNADGERVGAMKELTGVLMMAGMFGGLAGMPLYSAMTYALMAVAGPDPDDDEDVAKLMEGDPRTAYNPDIFFRNWVKEKFGEPTEGGVSLVDILTDGPISALTDTELASSTSLDLKNMWFRDAVVGDSTEDTLLQTAVANIAGLSMAAQFMRAYDSFAEGNIRDGLRKALPAFFRTWFNAGFNEYEGVKNRRGDTIIPKEDISAADNFRDVLGFRRPELARIQKYNAVRVQREAAIDRERKGILDRFERGVLEGAIASRADVDAFLKEEVAPFNRTYPAPEFFITEETLAESIKRRAGVRSRTVQGMQLDKKSAPKDYTAQQRFTQ